MGRKSESADFSAFRTVTCRHISLYVVSHARQNVATDLVGGTRGGAELLDVSLNGDVDLLGSVVESEMLEQHGGGEDAR